MRKQLFYLSIHSLLKFFGLLVIVLLASCAENKAPILNVGTNVWLGYEPMYMARDLDFYDSNKIHLVEYASTSQVIQAFRNGLIKAAGLTLDEALLLQARGYDIRIVLVMDFSNGADAIIAHDPITSMSGLRGKRIGVENNALGAFVVSRALEISGVSPDDIEIVPLEVSQHEAAFVNNEIDAVVTFDPVKSRLISAGGKNVFDSKQMPGEIVDVLVIDHNYFKSNPQQVEHLLDGWFKALSELKAHPEQSAKVMGKRLKLDVEELLSAYQGINLPSADENQALLSTDNKNGLLTTAVNLKKIMRDNNLLEGELDLEKLFAKP